MSESVMSETTGELHKLRIDKQHKARRDEKTVWPWVVLFLLLLGGGAAYWQWQHAAATIVVETVRVRVPEATSTAKNDLVVLNATGYVVASHKIELASKVVGRVAWVGVEMGDKIEKGQVLVRLEDDEYKARFAQEQGQLDAALAKLAELEAGSRPEEIATAQAAVDRAVAEFTVAELNFKRMSEMESRAVSKQQIEDAEALMNSRKAQLDSERQQLQLAKVGPRKEQIDAQRGVVRQLEGGLALAKVDLDNTVIRSQISATVLERNVEVGEFVTTGFVGDRGAKGYVVSIADLSDLRVELDVSQDQIAKASMNQPCWITTDAYPDHKYEGIVTLISPEANRQKATVQVRVKVLNTDGLMKPDMNATVSFLSMKPSTTQTTTTQASGAQSAARPPIRVPTNAVKDGYVFVVENGLAMKRRVTIGLKSANGEIEITKGLIGGEDLVVSPSATLKDQDAVTVQTNPN